MIVCKAPIFGSFGTGCLPLVDTVCEFIFGNRRSCGNFKGRHVGGFGWDEGFVCPLLPLIPLNKVCYLCVIYVLFIHYLT